MAVMTHKPRSIPQVMVSSTFTDLREHRSSLIAAIHHHKLHANVMEHDAAKPHGDVIDSSMDLVRDSAAFIGVIGLKYGQVPHCPLRNPEAVSLSELEFNEAQRLGRPILLFIMSDLHPVTKADIERDPEKERKLDAFRERAKEASSDSTVHRVYAVFCSLDDFKEKLAPSLFELGKCLDFGEPDASVDDSADSKDTHAVPKAPALYAVPAYIGSHSFVGRAAELQALTDWAAAADPTNLLLFEAIGGNGKSMLTWEWTMRHAPAARSGRDAWAGRFWYSFYEKGATMAEFCRHALAYMTGQPFDKFEKLGASALSRNLLAELRTRPWLFILDGLERVLVAYHRIDAAEVPDEQASDPKDKIVDRNPCDAIRDEDNDLLRDLAAASPSKILISSRLTPRVLLNPSGQSISGAKRMPLSGLRPPDAEKLLRSTGIDGDSDAIQNYLTANCDNHPLLIGVLGGLINYYLPARGDFDAWVASPDGGAKLDFANLDLVHRRNHILRAAFDALSPHSLQLLVTLALLYGSIDYETLEAFNPHLPAQQFDRPGPPGEVEAGRRSTRIAAPDRREALKRLAATVRDLELRGLLQYDHFSRRHDLHPVVRGVASSRMGEEDSERYGQRVLDYFSAKPHRPFEQAETLEELRPGLNVVRTLIRMGRAQQAASEYRDGVGGPLYINVDAPHEVLEILRPLFLESWAEPLQDISTSDAAYLSNCAGNALASIGKNGAAAKAYESALRSNLDMEDEWNSAGINLIAFADCQKRMAIQERLLKHAIALAEVSVNPSLLLPGRLQLYAFLGKVGRWQEQELMWPAVEETKDYSEYPRGYVEFVREMSLSRRGNTDWARWAAVEQLVNSSRSVRMRRLFCVDVGGLRMDQGNWDSAATMFAEAVRLARESSIPDAEAETGMALAKLHLGRLADPLGEVTRLAQLSDASHIRLAWFWIALGDEVQAKRHALKAYEDAWANGEPYVNRYRLQKSQDLLRKLNVPVPELPAYDAREDVPLSWEPKLEALIEGLRAERNAKG